MTPVAEAVVLPSDAEASSGQLIVTNWACRFGALSGDVLDEWMWSSNVGSCCATTAWRASSGSGSGVRQRDE
jgi:hypothetical protein